MATYQTPGVYVEEISTLPPSVAQVATAIPAFIGYTEKGPTPDAENNVEPQVARLNTMLEFETLFGGARSGQYEIGTRVDPTTQLQHVSEVTRLTPDYEFLLYYVLSLYFKNGGGSCYVVSVGTYETTPDIKHFEAGLRALEKEDEPTLIMLTDATHLLSTDDYYNLCGQALAQCHKLRDRFAILDVVDGAVDSFRNASSLSDNLIYGAAYHPYLQTLIPYKYRETDVTVVAWEGTFGDNGIVISYRGSNQPAARITQGDKSDLKFETTLLPAPRLTINNVGEKTGTEVVAAWTTWKAASGATSNGFDIKTSGTGQGAVESTTGTTAKLQQTEATPPTWEGTFGDNGIVISYTEQDSEQPEVIITKGDKSDLKFETTLLPAPRLTINNVGEKTGTEVVAAWTTWKAASGATSNGFDIKTSGTGQGAVEPTTGPTMKLQRSQLKMESIRTTETALYNQIKAELNQQRVVLPPSAAVAGIYARVDRERGVWKAPANVGVASVLGPVRKITHEDQATLNVDPTGRGKSINALRAFTGKGTLVWGARTLAGEDNEWRYVPVRRLFIMIEESIQKATAFAVFEPNDAATWLKVKAMIESYLYGLWEQGALAGSTPEAAYFVQIGLGKTMTPQDVLGGRMIVEVGVAAVRPAEFILLRFTHNLQEA